MTSGTPAIVIGGVASGVGKTSITLGILEACRRRGVTVQAFKVGPDFIDPEFHRAVTGRPSYNLDGWMCGEGRVRETFARAEAGAERAEAGAERAEAGAERAEAGAERAEAGAERAEAGTALAIVEGMMGCFDGRTGASDDGSTAQIAKWLGLPLILVVDVSAQARSAAAVVLGFERLDPDLDVAGVIVNRAGGTRHARDVADAIRASCRATLLGAVEWSSTLTLPERHLGLVTAMESLTSDTIARLGDAVERAVDLDRLRELARPATGAPSAERVRTVHHDRPRATIGVARDVAFQFYYEENLERLREAGASLVFWSPLRDAELPDVDGLYFGGGYPELHAGELARNTSLHKAIRRFVEAGKPLYAECGGLMYLAEQLEDDQGAHHSMVGLLPTTVRMRPRRLHLGYTETMLVRDTVIGPAGAVARGHVFHFSTLDPVRATVPRAYRLESERTSDPSGPGDEMEGFVVGSALLSYVHLHFASNPAIATAFVERCARS